MRQTGLRSQTEGVHSKPVGVLGMSWGVPWMHGTDRTEGVHSKPLGVLGMSWGVPWMQGTDRTEGVHSKPVGVLGMSGGVRRVHETGRTGAWIKTQDVLRNPLQPIGLGLSHWEQDS